MSSSPLVVALGAVCLAVNSTAAQQDPVEVIEECSTCRIETELRVRLGDSNGPGIIESDSDWARMTPDGHYLVVPESGDRIKVFSPDGGYVRTIGRRGQGPGEFRTLLALIVRGDTINAFDRGNGRQTQLTVAGDVIGSRSIGAVAIGPALALMPDGKIVRAGPVSTGNARGLPLHLLSQDGQRIIRSFGLVGGPESSSRDAELRRVMAVHDDRSIWAAAPDRYELELWSVDGVRLRTLRREAEWFPPNSGERQVDEAPDPFIARLQEVSGVVWVLAGVPDPDWRQGLDLDSMSFHGGRVIDQNAYLDTVIEAVDAESGRLLGTTRIDPYVYTFLGPGSIGYTELASDYEPHYVVADLTIVSQGGGR